MNKNYLFSFLFLCLFSNLSAQELEVTQHDFSLIGNGNIGAERFVEDGNGHIWVYGRETVHGRILRYDGTNWEEIEFTPCTNCLDDIAPNNQGIIHASSFDGIYKYVDNAWEYVRSSTSSKIKMDSENRFVGSYGSTMYIYDNDSQIAEFSTIEGTDISNVEDLMIDSQDNIWFVDFQRNLFYYSQDGSQQTAYTGYLVAHIALDSQDKLWFNDTDGAIGYIEDGQVFENVKEDQAPLNESPDRAMVIDNDDVMWVGTYGIPRGVVRIAGNTGITFPFQEYWGGGYMKAAYSASNNSKWFAAPFSDIVLEVRDDQFSSISEFSNVTSGKIYPNPAQNQITLELTTLVADEFNLDIIDFNGRIIANEKVIATAGFVTTNIDVSNLAVGFYTVRISNNEGVQTEKVLIQR